MPFWPFKKKQPTPPTPAKKHVSITFQVVDDDLGLKVTADWPVPQNEEEGEKVCRQLIALVHCINGGYTLPMMQQAIAVNGDKTETSKVATTVLSYCGTTQAGGGKELEKPVVPPTEIFNTKTAEKVQ